MRMLNVFVLFLFNFYGVYRKYYRFFRSFFSDDTILNAKAHQVCGTLCIDIRFPFVVFSAIISTYANLCREPRKQNKMRINVLF